MNGQLKVSPFFSLSACHSICHKVGFPKIHFLKDSSQSHVRTNQSVKSMFDTQNIYKNENFKCKRKNMYKNIKT